MSEVKEKIGIGIVTCNRQHYLEKLLESVADCNWAEFIIVNDGDKLELPGYNYYLHNNEKNLGVGKSKNIAMKHLMDKGCDYIFIIEDDMVILDSAVFNKYIQTSKVSGIQHFNFSQHGYGNKKMSISNEVVPAVKTVIDYGKLKVAMYQHCVGSFSMYTRKCIETAGYIDENYYNACEHVDHTYEIIKHGMHPPFWYFADIEESWKYIGDHGWSMQTSFICSRPDFSENVRQSDKVFLKKHGTVPGGVYQSTQQELVASLKLIKQKWT